MIREIDGKRCWVKVVFCPVCDKEFTAGSVDEAVAVPGTSKPTIYVHADCNKLEVVIECLNCLNTYAIQDITYYKEKKMCNKCRIMQEKIDMAAGNTFVECQRCGKRKKVELSSADAIYRGFQGTEWYCRNVETMAGMIISNTVCPECWAMHPSMDDDYQKQAEETFINSAQASMGRIINDIVRNTGATQMVDTTPAVNALLNDLLGRFEVRIKRKEV